MQQQDGALIDDSDTNSSTPLFDKFRLRGKLKPINYPVENKFLQRKGNGFFRVGVCCMQGRRETMEDAHSVILKMEKHPNHAFFGIFDGHEGRDTSSYCAENLWKKIDACDEFTKEAITAKVLELDDEVINLTSGSTATFAIIDSRKSESGHHVIVGNIGDSRTIKGHYSVPDMTCITVDHKPTLPDEKSRIESAGGSVMRNRVDGTLAVSRAFGDILYKSNTALPKDKQKIICVPDLTEIYLGPDDFLFISCDGIFESFTNETALQYIHSKIKESQDPAGILSEFLGMVLKNGSRDNMSSMLVECISAEDYNRGDEFILGRWHPNGNDTYVQGYRMDCENHGLRWEDVPRTGSGMDTLEEEGGDKVSFTNLSQPQRPLLMAERSPPPVVRGPPRAGSQSSRNLVVKSLIKPEDDASGKTEKSVKIESISEKVEKKEVEKSSSPVEKTKERKKPVRTQSGKPTSSKGKPGLRGKSATLKKDTRLKK